MAVAVFESLTEKVCDGTCYGFTNMRVQKYPDERVLKAILTKEILVKQTIGLKKSDGGINVCAKDTKIVGKIVSIDLETLNQTYFCSICNVPVFIEIGLA